MLGNLLFKRQQASDALPSEVLAALDGATITDRAQSEDGTQRVLVHIATAGAVFHHDPKTDAKRLRDAFGLDEAQGERAARHLRNVIAARRNRAERDARAADSSAWAAWKPLPPNR